MIRLFELAVAAALVAAGYYGLAEFLWTNDHLYFVTVMTAVGVPMFFLTQDRVDWLENLAPAFLAAGLLGNVAGFAMILPHIANAAEFAQALKGGGVALQATGVGIVFHELFRLKAFLISKRVWQ